MRAVARLYMKIVTKLIASKYSWGQHNLHLIKLLSAVNNTDVTIGSNSNSSSSGSINRSIICNGGG